MECGQDLITMKREITFRLDPSYLNLLSNLRICTVLKKEVSGIRNEEYGFKNGTKNDIQIGGNDSAEIFFGFYPVTSRLD